ncbi:MAG TPA: ABC transporter permease [Thermoanaerobaculia bacterium]|jgi:ABC-2 type transport system permease protein
MNGRIFAALLRRDALVARREVVSLLIRTALQPVLFVVVFGFVLPRIGMIPRGYGTTMIPGVAALCVAMAAMWAVAMPLITDFGYTKEIEDRLLAPVPIELIALEKVVSGIVQGLFAAAVVLPLTRLIMGRLPFVTYSHPFELLLFMILGGAAFSALGLVLGTVMQPQQISIMMSVILVPMIMFGCVYYPWGGLTKMPVLKYAVLINPLVYISEGLRAALTPDTPHMPVPIIITALVVLTAAGLVLGLRTFRKKAIT